MDGGTLAAQLGQTIRGYWTRFAKSGNPNGKGAVEYRLLARVVGGLLDNCIDVAKAGIVGARHNPGDRDGRAFALIEDDVEAFGVEVALLLREVVPSVDALKLEIEREFDRCEPLAGGRIGADGCQLQKCEQHGCPVKARHRFSLRCVQLLHAV